MGMRAFVIIWFGQVVSILGSAMTAFAVTIWIYEDTGKATALALAGFFFVTPLLLFSPVAGAMVDRYNRRLMMMISDLASGATTIVLLVLYTSGHLQVWHLFFLNAINGAFQAFQWPAFSAAISMMVSKEQYGRANGMMELAGTGSQIFAPVLAGALLVPLGFGGILLIDVFTFAFAVGSLLFVNIPQPETTHAGREAQGNLFSEAIYGFYYIWQRPSLLGLQLVFMFGNFFVSVAGAVYAAMILARTANDELVFGTVQSVGAIGGLIGAAVMAAWGGPKRRVNGVLGGWVLTGLFYALAGVARSLPAWAAAGFLGFFLVPIVNGANQAIWQAKVAPDVQGRVFSIRRLIAWFVSPLAALIAGPLVDLLLEPAMAEGGMLADTWGWLLGVGAGAGMGLLFVIGGLLASLIGLVGYTVPAVRDAEDILPDHDSPEAQAERATEAESPLGPQVAPADWSLGRKAATVVAAAVLAALIVGLGWLQVQAF
jgi:MFS family permease